MVHLPEKLMTLPVIHYRIKFKVKPQTGLVNYLWTLHQNSITQGFIILLHVDLLFLSDTTEVESEACTEVPPKHRVTDRFPSLLKTAFLH